VEQELHTRPENMSSPPVLVGFVLRRWFSPCTPVSSTTKTGRHDIAEILLKVALNTKNQIKSTKRKRINSDLQNIHIEDRAARIPLKPEVRVECTLFAIYKAGREPTLYW
jgi:hypothetical protein